MTSGAPVGTTGGASGLPVGDPSGQPLPIGALPSGPSGVPLPIGALSGGGHFPAQLQQAFQQLQPVLSRLFGHLGGAPVPPWLRPPQF